MWIGRGVVGVGLVAVDASRDRRCSPARARSAEDAKSKPFAHTARCPFSSFFRNKTQVDPNYQNPICGPLLLLASGHGRGPTSTTRGFIMRRNGIFSTPGRRFAWSLHSRVRAEGNGWIVVGSNAMRALEIETAMCEFPSVRARVILIVFVFMRAIERSGPASLLELETHVIGQKRCGWTMKRNEGRQSQTGRACVPCNQMNNQPTAFLFVFPPPSLSAHTLAHLPHALKRVA